MLDLLNISKEEFTEHLQDKDGHNTHFLIGNGVNCHIHNKFLNFSFDKICIDEQCQFKTSDESPTALNISSLLKDVQNSEQLSLQLMHLFKYQSLFYNHPTYKEVFDSSHDFTAPLYDGIYQHCQNQLQISNDNMHSERHQNRYESLKTVLGLTDFLKLLKFSTQGNKKNSIYTTNYDLLLIWVKAHLKFIKFGELSTGFKSNNTEGYKWNSFNEDNKVVFLNGNVCFYNDNNDLKRYFHEENHQIPVKIIEGIMQGSGPYVFSESSTLKQTDSSYPEGRIYIEESFQQLSKESGYLFIIGSSISFSEEHIWALIKENKSFEKIFVSLHFIDAFEVRQRAERFLLEEGIENVYFYDSKWLWEFATQRPNPDPRE